eukprot:SAG31_NODE_30221_length_384_cov_0.550877_1_plen_20_part_10
MFTYVYSDHNGDMFPKEVMV